MGKRNVCEGDIVIIQDANSIRGHWKLAQVVATEASRDGKVRNVTLRYKPQRSGNNYVGQRDICIKRSVHRLNVLLPIEEINDSKVGGGYCS